MLVQYEGTCSTPTLLHPQTQSTTTEHMGVNTISVPNRLLSLIISLNNITIAYIALIFLKVLRKGKEYLKYRGRMCVGFL